MNGVFANMSPESDITKAVIKEFLIDIFYRNFFLFQEPLFSQWLVQILKHLRFDGCACGNEEIIIVIHKKHFFEIF